MNSQEPIIHQGPLGVIEIEPVARRSRRVPSTPIARYMRRAAQSLRGRSNQRPWQATSRWATAQAPG